MYASKPYMIKSPIIKTGKLTAYILIDSKYINIFTSYYLLFFIPFVRKMFS